MHAGVSVDNGVKADSSIEKLSSLKPAFVKPHGTHTAGTLQRAETRCNGVVMRCIGCVTNFCLPSVFGASDSTIS